MHSQAKPDIVMFGWHCVFIEEMPLSIGRSPMHMPLSTWWPPINIQTRTAIVMLVAFIEEMLSSIS